MTPQAVVFPLDVQVCVMGDGVCLYVRFCGVIVWACVYLSPELYLPYTAKLQESTFSIKKNPITIASQIYVCPLATLVKCIVMPF